MKLETNIPTDIIANLLAGCNLPLEGKEVEIQKMGYIYQKKGGGETMDKSKAEKDSEGKEIKVYIDDPEGTMVKLKGATEETVKQLAKKGKKTKTIKVDGKNKTVADTETKIEYSDNFDDLTKEQKKVIGDALAKCYKDFLSIEKLAPKVEVKF